MIGKYKALSTYLFRSQSSKRYQEMERERKRRQLKTAGGENGKTSFLQTAKLGLMNSGIISLKKGEKPNKIGKQV